MDAINIGSILVAAIAALSAYASQRAAAKATMINTAVSAKVEAERGAYERARDFDTDLINRQNEEIEELREENKCLKDELKLLRQRVFRLEKGLPPDHEEKVDG